QVSDAYYTALLLLGLPGRYADPSASDLKTLETFCITFQMSWGYPGLLARQKRMAALEATARDYETVRDAFKTLNEAIVKLQAPAAILMNKVSPIQGLLFSGIDWERFFRRGGDIQLSGTSRLKVTHDWTDDNNWKWYGEIAAALLLTA